MERPQHWIFQCRSNFFGLRPEHRPRIHENIFQLIYYGQGFTHDDVYNMPTYLRNFYFQQLSKVKEEEKKTKRNNLAISLAAISAVAVFGIILTL